MKIALAQLNPTVGDLSGNLALLERCLNEVQAQTPDLVVFPEMFLVGYPPRDLLERDWFIDRAEQALEHVRELSRRYSSTGIIVGTVVYTGQKTGKRLFNVAVLMSQGRELFRQAKSLLPTYDVFDEARYFQPALKTNIVQFQGEKLGITICEDAWNSPELSGMPSYHFDPVAQLAQLGATLLINIAASPFWVGKPTTRFRLLSAHARHHRLPLLFLNQVGGNDELIFDGQSMVFDSAGNLRLLLPPFRPAVSIFDTTQPGEPVGFAEPEPIELVHDALVLGIRDYVRKCGFTKVVLGLSGGIDSAVTCCLAVRALGKENVLGVTMPSEYSSPGSIADSKQLAQNLGIELLVIPISAAYHSYLGMLKEVFAGRAMDVTEENIQARIRGNILMAISNKFGHLVLNTGNKSELAVGYCTLYGDMTGGLSVLADVPKTMVYQLAAYINRHGAVIPPASIEKPPSAELRPNQKDQDLLPPYEVLDHIIRRYVDEGASPEDIVAEGVDEQMVLWTVRAIDKNEFKRRQAAPGIKVTAKAFGMGRRFPVAARLEH